MDLHRLSRRAYETILDLATPEGINASDVSERFGCIFGRDSAITILKILSFLTKDKSTDIDRAKLLAISRQTLLTLAGLQGREVNIESGEEPGKFIHEFRRDKYEHLTQGERPWYIYPDGTLRNYDSIDSTPLNLIAIYRYWEVSHDDGFVLSMLPGVKAGLSWMMTFADKDHDFLLEYDFPKVRKSGGLLVQSWTDSSESLKKADGEMPCYPIAPVEVQGYGWLAFMLWADFFAGSEPAFAGQLQRFSGGLKREFNKKFLFKSHDLSFPAQALDGEKNQIKTVTGNPLLILWASYRAGGRKETVLKDEFIPDLVARSFMPDMFVPGAGIRTMSEESETFNSGCDSYHNGSFWPKLNGMAHEGLTIWGYQREAEKLKEATITPLIYFKTPIELYIKGPGEILMEYCSKTGSQGCRSQAWTAAVALDMLSL